MSEQILSDTSAQLGYSYTVPFTLAHAGTYVTEDKSKTDITKTKHNPEQESHAVAGKPRDAAVNSDRYRSSLLALCWSNISQSNAVSQWMHRVCVNTVCLKKQKNMYY